MNEIIIFILGILFALFLIGIVYTFIGVVKITKKYKDQENYLENLQRFLDESFKMSDDKIIESVNDVRSEFERIYDEIDGTKRYIDSRIDKLSNTQK